MLTRFTLLGCALLLLALLPSTASATHVSCGDVITQDTTLDSDLVNCPSDGVVIGASGIRLDLAGHTIDGMTAAGGAGVNNRAGHDGVAVTDGTIREFVFGVEYRDAQGASLTRLDMSSSFFLSLQDSSDIRIDRNVADLIEIDRSHRIEVTRNRVMRRLRVGDTDDLVIDRNTITGGNGQGIELTGTPAAVIARNVITVTGENLPSFVAGITIASHPGGRPTLVDRNEISGSVTGIRLATAVDVVLTDNSVFANTADGILVTNSANVLVDRNRAERNGDDGIDVESPGVTISNNTANFNGDLGIEAVPGVVDGGGNKAHGNGNPAQCMNVQCK